MNLTHMYYRFRRKMCHLRDDRRGVVRWSNLMEDRKVLPLLRTRFDPVIPPAVNIEITTHCNYGCSFCPQSSRRRPSRQMSAEDFAIVARKLAEIRFDGLVVLAVNNEPFMHPLLMSFCESLSRDLPEAKCMLVSNGSLITQEQLDFLARLPHPPSLLVNDYTEGHVVTPRIHDMLALLETPGSLPVTILPRSSSEVLSNRAGNQGGCDSHVEDYRDIVCTWPFTSLFISADLKAFLCCSDYEHEVIVGDLRTTRIMDIWKGELYRGIRHKMLTSQRAELGLCSKCDAEWFSLPKHCEERPS